MAWNDFTGSGPGGSWIVGDRFGNNQVEIIRQNFVTVKGVRLYGSGSPEGTVTASVGELYRRTDGGPGTTLYIKESGAGSTGWRPVGVAPPAPVVLSASVLLTDTQIKALPTTPVAIIAAPGAGFRNRVITASYRIDATAGAYTGIDATAADLSLVLGPSFWRASDPIYNDSASSKTLLTDFLGNAHSRVVDIAQKWDYELANLGIPADIGGKALQFRAFQGTGLDFTGGNAANTLRVTVYYAVEQL